VITCYFATVANPEQVARIKSGLPGVREWNDWRLSNPAVKIDLSETKLPYFLNGINLSSANLTGANIYGSSLVRARLDEATLIGANLNETNLAQAHMTAAKLTSCSLQKAVMYFTIWTAPTCAGLIWQGPTCMVRTFLVLN
jgi:hypothetical protein